MGQVVATIADIQLTALASLAMASDQTGVPPAASVRMIRTQSTSDWW